MHRSRNSNNSHILILTKELDVVVPIVFSLYLFLWTILTTPSVQYFLPHSFWLHLYCLHSHDFKKKLYSLIVYNIFLPHSFWLHLYCLHSHGKKTGIVFFFVVAPKRTASTAQPSEKSKFSGKSRSSRASSRFTMRPSKKSFPCRGKAVLALQYAPLLINPFNSSRPFSLSTPRITAGFPGNRRH